MPGFAAETKAAAPRLVLVRQHPTPVITTRTPGAEGIRYGFEGGRAVKVGGTYHLFTTEMVSDPMWVKTRFGHWTSRDRLAWTRVATVRESSGEFEGKDPRAALWSPLAVWDPGEDRWNLFYVAYRSMPTDGTRFLLNHAGEIWRAVSKASGPEGHRRAVRGRGRRDAAGPRLARLGGPSGNRLLLPLARGRPLAGALRQRAHRDEADHSLARRACRGAVARRARGGAWARRTPPRSSRASSRTRS